MGKKRSAGIILLITFSFFNIYIYMVQNGQLMSKVDYLTLILNVATLTIALYFFTRHISKSFIAKKKRIENRVINISSDISNTKYFICTWFVQIIGWIPVFLAYYPGLFAYDVMAQIPQSMGSYSTHHPLLHTLYLQFFYYIVGGSVFKNYTVGIALATICQMLIFSAMLSYVQLFLRRMHVLKVIRYALVIFVSISPVFSMLAISMTKDVFFAGSIAVLFTSLGYHYKLRNYCDKRFYMNLVLAIAGTIWFRNNGIYPVIMLEIAAFMARKGHDGVKLLKILTIGIVFGISISTLLTNVLGANKGSLNEALSLPYQQIACAYNENYEVISETDKELVFRILPSVENYRPDCADWIKGDGQGTTYLFDFIRLYLDFFIKFPKNYLDAFLNLDAGYLSITDVTYAEIYGTTDRQGIFLTDTKAGFDINHVSHFPFLENMYETLYTENKFENIFVGRLTCSPAVYFWLLITVMVYAYVDGKKELTPMIVFIITLLVTILAGPCALIRYALPYIICTPVMWVCAATNVGGYRSE